MAIERVGGIMEGSVQGISLLSPQRLGGKAQEAASFAQFLQAALGQVNRLQVEGEQAAEALAAGNLEDLHNLLIKTEQAQLSLQLTVQVVNKVIQAYQDISRMHI